MSDNTRKPKFDFMARPRRYGKLDISYELVVCTVQEGRLIPDSYPKSWEDAVLVVGTAEERARAMPYITSRPTLLLGLNDDRDGYEVVYDPHDLAGQIDPMMLLNFRRKV